MSTMETGTQTGPASYSAGGFTITTGLASVDWAAVTVKTIGTNLPPFHAEYTRSGAGVTVKLMRHRYDKTGASVGAVSGLPAGVSSAATSGQTYDANTAHTHSIDHDHGAVTSGAADASTATAGVNATLGSGNYSTHTHSFDVPAFTGTSGTTTHTHTNNNIYQHQHSVTNTETDEASSEIAGGTDLSGTTFYYVAVQA